VILTILVTMHLYVLNWTLIKAMLQLMNIIVNMVLHVINGIMKNEILFGVVL